MKQALVAAIITAETRHKDLSKPETVRTFDNTKAAASSTDDAALLFAFR
jgi:hypothetical protein